jgi:hypothetical protein
MPPACAGWIGIATSNAVSVGSIGFCRSRSDSYGPLCSVSHFYVYRSPNALGSRQALGRTDPEPEEQQITELRQIYIAEFPCFGAVAELEDKTIAGLA